MFGNNFITNEKTDSWRAEKTNAGLWAPNLQCFLRQNIVYSWSDSCGSPQEKNKPKHALHELIGVNPQRNKNPP